MRILLGHARPHLPILALSLLLALAGSAAGLAQPFVAQVTIEKLGDGRSPLVPALLLSALVLGSAIANGINVYVLGRTGEQVVLDVRRRIAARLVRLRMIETDSRPPGDLIARATSDTTLIRTAATSAPVEVINGLVGLVGALICMALLDLRLFGLTAMVLAVVVVVFRCIVPRLRVITERAQTAVGFVGSALDRALGAARTIKASGAEAQEQKAIDRASLRAYRAGLAGARWNAWLAAVSDVAMQASFIAVLGVGGSFVAAGTLQVSALIAFLLLLFYIGTPISETINAIGAIQQGRGAITRLAEVDEMAIEQDVDATPARSRPSRPSPPSLQLQGVRFDYPGRRGVLRGVSFGVTAGSRVAIVGPSGSGKSTILDLLQRFYDPSAGTIRLDGLDITTLTRAQLRQRIGYVEQDAPALDGTLRENLRYAQPDATDEVLGRVVADTRLDALIERLPDGLDTRIGPRGQALSGGERQRLAIARAVLREPDLLLLDEATAHLDRRTEEALRTLVSGESLGCTVLVVSHRLSTIRDADRIILLERGLVRASGTHDELIANDALYRELSTDRTRSGRLDV